MGGNVVIDGQLSASLGITGSALYTATTTIDSTHVSSSLNISGSAFYGDGSNLTGISTADTLQAVTDNGGVTTNSITVANLVATELTGSLTKLRSGLPYLVAGSNVTISYESNGQITISSTGGSGDGSAAIALGAGIIVISDDGPGGTYRAILNKYHDNASSYASKVLYLANTGSSPVESFTVPHKFYFNESGVWHPSPFSAFGNNAIVTTASIGLPDMHDIVSLDGDSDEDRAILTGFYNNSGSYSGRIAYLTNTGSTAIGPFVSENKYYFNENGVWYSSPFHSQ